MNGTCSTPQTENSSKSILAHFAGRAGCCVEETNGAAVVEEDGIKCTSPLEVIATWGPCGVKMAGNIYGRMRVSYDGSRDAGSSANNRAVNNTPVTQLVYFITYINGVVL